MLYMLLQAILTILLGHIINNNPFPRMKVIWCLYGNFLFSIGNWIDFIIQVYNFLSQYKQEKVLLALVHPDPIILGCRFQESIYHIILVKGTSILALYCITLFYFFKNIVSKMARLLQHKLGRISRPVTQFK